MKINAFIHFNGECRKAVEFYAKVFEIEQPEFKCYGDTQAESEPPLTKEEKKRVAFTYLEFKRTMVMFSDCPPGAKVTKGTNSSLLVVTKRPDEVERLCAQLKKGGTVHFPPQKTPWSKCFCSVTDKFGVQWQITVDSKKMWR